MLSSALSSLDDREADLYAGDRPARGAGRGRRRRDGGGARGGGESGGSPEDARAVHISKKLSYLLRHGAGKEGVPIDEGGWVRVEDLFQWPSFSRMHVSFAELEHVVATNSKKRYELDLLPSGGAQARQSAHLDFETSDTAASPSLAGKLALASDDPQPSPSPSPSPSAYRIRATQGHSLSTVQSSSLLIPMDPASPMTPRYVVHGTTPAAWESIRKSGLSRMGRAHVHFATGTGDSEGDRKALALIAGKEEAPEDAVAMEKSVEHTHGVAVAGQRLGSGSAEKGPDGATPVISGMRTSANMLIWVDVKKSAMEGGLVWWRSANGVVLTEGEARGMVPMRWVVLVEKRMVRGKGTAKGKEKEKDKTDERTVVWRPEGES